jgi:hypothetical protein
MAMFRLVLWKRRRPSKGPMDRRRHRRRLEFLTLEERQVPTPVSITAVASPNVLPDNGRFVPVTISGTVEQVLTTDLGKAMTPPPADTRATIDAALESKPGPKLDIFVTDEYGTIEPRLFRTLSQITVSNTFFNPFNSSNGQHANVALVRDFSYSFTVNLQARSHAISRQYSINVSAVDNGTVVQQNIAAFVPTSNAHVKTPFFQTPPSVTGLPGLSHSKKH